MQGPTSFASLYNKRSENVYQVENAMQRMNLHNDQNKQNVEQLKRLNNAG